MPKENLTSKQISLKTVTQENDFALMTLNCLIHKSRATKLAIGKYTR